MSVVFVNYNAPIPFYAMLKKCLCKTLHYFHSLLHYISPGDSQTSLFPNPDPHECGRDLLGTDVALFLM